MKFTVDADTNVLPRFYLQYTGTAPTNANLNSQCATIAAAWTGAFQQWYPAPVVLTEVTAFDIFQAPFAEGFANVSDPGTRTGNQNPASTCAVVNFAIPRRYRGGKPKIFLPLGVNADLTAAGQWAPGFTTGVTAAWQNFIQGCKSPVWSGGTIPSQANLSLYQKFEVVTSPTTGRARNVPLYRATAIVDAVSGGTCSPIVGSQRRRNRGGG